MNALHLAAEPAVVNWCPQDLVRSAWARQKCATHLWRTDLSDSAKVVAAAILGYFERGVESVWPSAKTIGERCGKSERTVRRAVAELRETGWLLTKRRKFRGPMVYTILNPARPDLIGQEQPSQATVSDVQYAPYRPNLAGERKGDSKILLEEEILLYEESPSSTIHSESHTSEVVVVGLGVPAREELGNPHSEISPPPGEVWPIGHIRRCHDPEAARKRVGVEAATWLGYGIGNPRWPDGSYADAAVLAALPPKTLAWLIQECRKGRLDLKAVAQACVAQGLHRFRTEPKPLEEALRERRLADLACRNGAHQPGTPSRGGDAEQFDRGCRFVPGDRHEIRVAPVGKMTLRHDLEPSPRVDRLDVVSDHGVPEQPAIGELPVQRRDQAPPDVIWAGFGLKRQDGWVGAAGYRAGSNRHSQSED